MALVIVAIVAGWTAIEAALALSRASHPNRRMERLNLFSGRIDWQS